MASEALLSAPRRSATNGCRCSIGQHHEDETTSQKLPCLWSVSSSAASPGGTATLLRAGLHGGLVPPARADGSIVNAAPAPGASPNNQNGSSPSPYRPKLIVLHDAPTYP